MNTIDILKKYGREEIFHLGLTDNTSESIKKFIEPIERVTSVEVLQSEIPYCDFTIDSFRKKLYLNISGVDITSSEFTDEKTNLLNATFNNSGSYFVELNEGDHTLDDLTTEINDKLNSHQHVSGFTVTVDKFMKLTFSNSIYKTWSLIPGELKDILGIMKDTASDQSGNISAPHPINLKPDQFISIKCNELDSVITRGRNNDPKFTGLSEQIIRNRNVKDQIYVPFKRTFFPISKLNQLTISFQRRDGTLYDFKGRSWYLKLVVHTIVMSEDEKIDLHPIKAPVSNPNILPYASNHYY